MLRRFLSRKRKIGAEHHVPEIARPLRKLQQGIVEPTRRLMASTHDRSWTLALSLYGLLRGDRRRDLRGMVPL